MDEFCTVRFVSTRDAYYRIFFNDLFVMQPWQATCFSLNASIACAAANLSALGGLSALEALDLSENQLSGESVRGFCVFVLACPYVVRNNRYFTKGSNKRRAM